MKMTKKELKRLIILNIPYLGHLKTPLLYGL